MKKQHVPFFDLTLQVAQEKEDFERALKKVLSSGRFILGKNVVGFERVLARFCGIRYAVGVASGSDALWLSLLALGIGPGDEVITTPYTFIATASAISKVGARPVFVDIEGGGFSIDSEKVKRAISKKTRAVIPVHLFGLCAPMDELLKLAKACRLLIVEDAAQSFGASFQRHPAGSIGKAGCLSFYPTKNLGGAGDGGMMVTDDQAVAERVRMLRVHGAAKKYFHEFLGWNSRLDEIQAAILLVKLKKLKSFIQARRKIAKIYLKSFIDLPICLPEEPEGFYHTYNQFVIRTPARDKLRDFLTQKGIGTEIYYPLPLHLQPCFAFLGYERGDFPNSELAARESLALPIFPEMSLRQVEFVADAVRKFFERRSR